MDYKYKDLFLQDSTKKELYITYDSREITNAELHSNQFELKESICSESELRFGGCEASVLKFKISNVFESLKGKKINVSMVLNGKIDAPFVFGEYRVESDAPTADRNFRDIIAYDKMYDIVNANVADWYNGLQFPMTLKAFRTSFVSQFDISEADVTLVNDSMVVEKTIETVELSGGDVARAICEINGCFGYINHNNQFDYIRLSGVADTYPSNDLYPSNEVWPLGANNVTTVSKSHYISCQYEDFKTAWIDAVEVRPEEESAGVIVGDPNGNVYTIFGNFLLYGKSEEQLREIANNLMPLLEIIQYRPCSVSAVGNPTICVGDSICLNTRYEIVNTYVLQRTLSGIQSLMDLYIAEGTEHYEKNINSSKNDVLKLKSKVNVLTRTVDETRSEIRDVESGLTSLITQTEGALEVKIADARKEATNHLSYDAENGLLVGGKTDGEWLGFRAQIMSGAFNVLNASGEILSSFGSTLIEIGRNTKSAVIRFCGGLGEIYYGAMDRFSKVEGLNIKSDNVFIMGDEISSLNNSYVEDYRENGGSLQGGTSYVGVRRDNIKIYSSFSDDCLELDDVVLPIGGMDSAIYVDPYNITLDSDRIDIYGDNGVYINNVLVSDSIQAMNALLGYGGDEGE